MRLKKSNDGWKYQLTSVAPVGSLLTISHGFTTRSKHVETSARAGDTQQVLVLVPDNQTVICVVLQ